MSPLFTVEGFRGEAAAAFEVADPGAEALRLLDPGVALDTLHWGRNYLYRARVDLRRGPLEVVVKQFRHGSRGARLRRRLSGDKAAKSWRIAHALAAAGFETPEPLLRLEAEAADGPSLYVTRFLPGRTELRYPLRARNAGEEAARFPGLDFGALIAAVARLARRLHDAGFWFRDFSVGNLLVDLEAAAAGVAPAIALVDLNRCRQLAAVSTRARMRDLARLPLDRADDRDRLLRAYFGGSPPAGAALAYGAARAAFHGRHRLKRRLRGTLAMLRSWLVPRGAHAHIPKPPAGAGARDKIVWDHLSDQPHSHAGRLERTLVRIADLPSHLRTWSALAGALPRIRRAYRELVAARGRAPFSWPAAGVGLRPDPRRPDELLAAFGELGLRRALLRLHPWQREHDAEEELARELAGRGVELAFTLPQSRELVRDPARWRAAVIELGERFLRYGRWVQIGQAINRSKWGIWNYDEYLELAAAAAEILRRIEPRVELAGPAVIDFEFHVTAAVANRRQPTLRFDRLASLLYVDRRGAPENRQLGFDTVDKVTLAAAIAASARQIGRPASWISEVNWPLREGPHSPAGRAVAVDEETQADYLARYFLLAYGSGWVERIDWWQLAARGYGLADPQPDGGLRRRPALRALAALERRLAGTLCHGAAPAPAGARWLRFSRPDGSEVWAGWSLAGAVAARLPAPPARAFDRDGEPLAPPGGERVELLPSVRYFELAPGG